MTRLIFGLNIHISRSFFSVPLPLSLAGAVMKKTLFDMPLVQPLIVIVRSQSGRWMVMSTFANDALPRR